MSDGANFSQQQEANLELNQELNQEFEYCLDDILASANFEPDPCAANASASASAAAYAASGQAGDPLAAHANRPSRNLLMRCAMSRRPIVASGVAR